MDLTVVVDWQNIFKGCEAKEVHINAIFSEILRMANERGSLREIRVFVPIFQGATGPWRLINDLQIKYNFSVEGCQVLREENGNGGEYKDVVDLKVLSWAITYSKSLPELVAFVCSDGHFTVAANVISGRQREFWVMEKSQTSQAILRNFPVRTINFAGETVLLPEPGPFLESTLSLVTMGQGTKEDKERVSIMKDISQLVAERKKPVTLESIQELTNEAANALKISEKEVKEAIKALLALKAIDIHPVSLNRIDVNPYSRIYQWLTQSQW